MNSVRSTLPLLLSLLAVAPGLSTAAEAALDRAGTWLGGYQLADGRSLIIVKRGRHVLAQIDQTYEVVLHPAGAARLAGDDGKLTIDFTVATNGNASGVSVTMPADGGLGMRARPE